MNTNQTISTLRNLLDYNTQYYVVGEVELKRVLDAWALKANSLKFKAVLQKYQEFVDQHIQQMQTFIEDEKIGLISTSNKIVEAMIQDTEDKCKHCQDLEVRDACLLSNIQVINHYKISIYGTAAAFAKTLEMDKAASIFRNAEINEKQIDDRLTQMAEFEINKKATAPFVLPV